MQIEIQHVNAAALFTIMAVGLLGVAAASYKEKFGIRVRIAISAMGGILAVALSGYYIWFILNSELPLTSTVSRRKLLGFGIAAAIAMCWGFGPGFNRFIKYITRPDESS